MHDFGGTNGQHLACPPGSPPKRGEGGANPSHPFVGRGFCGRGGIGGGEGGGGSEAGEGRDCWRQSSTNHLRGSVAVHRGERRGERRKETIHLISHVRGKRGSEGNPRYNLCTIPANWGWLFINNTSNNNTYVKTFD